VIQLTRELAADDLELARTPRHDLVVEVPDGRHRFTARAGPFATYERRISAGPDGRVLETISYRLVPMVWAWLLGPLYRAALRHRPPAGHLPWWSPPDAPDPRGCTALGSIAYLGLVFGFIGTLLTQTITFAADELDATKTDQGAVLSLVRIGVLGALVVTTLADRRGRRRVVVGCATVGCAVAAISAFAPDLVTLGVAQTVVRGCATAGGVLVLIVAAEEMPAGSRAYAMSLLAATGALGAGLCLMVLPLADLDVTGWRAVMLASALLLPVVRMAAHHLPESRRFTAVHADVAMAGHGARLWLLAASAFLLSVFTAPAAQLLNEFLRDEQGYSALRITLFTIVTNTPGGIGLVLGGMLADRRGRRGVGALGVVAGTLGTVTMVLLGGWPMWVLPTAAAVTGSMVVPALGVYGPELFPTSLRGRANGTIAILGVSGSVLGLLTAGWLTDRWGAFGPALALLSIGPLIMAVLVVLRYPETAQRELEDLNPEDRIRPRGAASDARGASVD
jgi:MFS family permease